MSLDDVAKVTKIQPRILERLETGHLDGLPAEVFVRGFVRSFARCVGLDEREALRRYAACAIGSQDLTPTVRALVEAMADLAPGSATAARATPRKMQAVEVIDLAGPIVLAAPADPEAPGAPVAAGAAGAAGAMSAELPVAELPVAELPVAAAAEAAAPIATAVEAPALAPQGVVLADAIPAIEPVLAAAERTASPVPSAASPVPSAASPVPSAASSFASKKKRGRRRRAREAAAAREAAEIAVAPAAAAAAAPPNHAAQPNGAAGSTARSMESNDAAGAAAPEPRAAGTPVVASSSAPWRWRGRRALAPAAPARPSLVIDDADPDSAERVQEQRAECADAMAPRRSLVPPILLDREDRSARQGGLTLAVILLLIAATLTLSYLMRRPSASGDGMTGREAPVQQADRG